MEPAGKKASCASTSPALQVSKGIRLGEAFAGCMQVGFTSIPADPSLLTVHPFIPDLLNPYLYRLYVRDSVSDHNDVAVRTRLPDHGDGLGLALVVGSIDRGGVQVQVFCKGGDKLRGGGCNCR